MKNGINIEKIAELSMLSISNEEKEIYRQDLEEIIAFAESITEADIGKEIPTESKIELKNVLRNDSITNRSQREDLLRNAETNDGIYVSVPKVIGGESKND